MIHFLKDWGGHLLAGVSAIIAWRAHAAAKKATEIAQTKHEWDEEDRLKKLAREASAVAEREWCEAMRDQLDASVYCTIPLPAQKREWADRGNGKYFQLVRYGSGIHMASLHAQFTKGVKEKQVIKP